MFRLDMSKHRSMYSPYMGYTDNATHSILQVEDLHMFKLDDTFCYVDRAFFTDWKNINTDTDVTLEDVLNYYKENPRYVAFRHNLRPTDAYLKTKVNPGFIQLTPYINVLDIVKPLLRIVSAIHELKSNLKYVLRKINYSDTTVPLFRILFSNASTISLSAYSGTKSIYGTVHSLLMDKKASKIRNIWRSANTQAVVTGYDLDAPLVLVNPFRILLDHYLDYCRISALFESLKLSDIHPTKYYPEILPDINTLLRDYLKDILANCRELSDLLISPSYISGIDYDVLNVDLVDKLFNTIFTPMAHVDLDGCTKSHLNKLQGIVDDDLIYSIISRTSHDTYVLRNYLSAEQLEELRILANDMPGMSETLLFIILGMYKKAVNIPYFKEIWLHAMLSDSLPSRSNHMVTTRLTYDFVNKIKDQSEIISPTMELIDTIYPLTKDVVGTLRKHRGNVIDTIAEVNLNYIRDDLWGNINMRYPSDTVIYTLARYSKFKEYIKELLENSDTQRYQELIQVIGLTNLILSTFYK